MYIRKLEPGDIEAILAIHKKSPMKYDIPILDSPNILTAQVVVDEDDKPKVLLCAERVAEMMLVMDHEWTVPAVRWTALQALYHDVVPRLYRDGIRSAYAFIGDDVPKGYVSRLMGLKAGRMTATALKWQREDFDGRP